LENDGGPFYQIKSDNKMKTRMERDAKRRRMFANQEETRKRLKGLQRSASTLEEQMLAMYDLDQLSPQGSITRIRNRCTLTGRSRGVYRFIGLSRIAFREAARNGELPGIKPASW
jgi:small subunit ribosomal protein S14